MITDMTKMNLVCLTFGVVIRDKYANKFQPVIRPIDNPQSKHFQNCLAFFNMSELTGESIYDLMRIGLDLYSEKWCEEKFYKPYLPFPILIGEAVRNRVYREIPDRAVKNVPHVMADRIAVIMGSFPAEVAYRLVNSGALVGDDKEAKDLVLAKLSTKARRKRDRG